jgi:Xaa-Pro dipeptidase
MLLNASRATMRLNESELDGLVATTKENFVYAADYDRTLMFGMPAPAAAIVAGDPARLVGLVVPRLEAGYLTQRDIHVEVLLLYGDLRVRQRADGNLNAYEANVMRLLSDPQISRSLFQDSLIEALRRLGLTGSTLGWDDVRSGQALTREVSGLKVVDGSDMWRKIRAVKTPDEIARLRRAAAITEEVEAKLIKLTTSGTEWRDIVLQSKILTIQAGGEPGFWFSAPGWYTGFSYESIEHKLQPGDLVRYDFGGTFAHYHSDTARTVIVGDADFLATQRHHALRAGLEEALHRVQPGTTYSELFATAMETSRKAGLSDYERHHCGHSIGLQHYDGDLVGPHCHTVLEPGMVLNIEMVYYELGWGGFLIEDTVVVTANGSELLTHLDRGMTIPRG